MKSKVVYLIYSADKNAIGGHFRSLNLIYSELINAGIISEDSSILNFGKAKSPVLSKIKNYRFIKDDISLILKLLKLITNSNAQVIHAFDEVSLFYGRILSFLLRRKVIYTKCGGANLNSYTNVPSIFFSKENYDDHQSKINGKAYYIPNRIKREPFKKLSEEQANILKLDSNALNILRINRFARTYKKTINKSIELVGALNRKGVKANLYIVGKITDDHIFDELNNDKPSYVYLITDDRITDEAKIIIPEFNAVIGTGRSVYESCSFGKPILCPTKSGFPIFVDRDNIESFLYYNFSERCQLEVDEFVEVESLIDILIDQTQLNRLSNDATYIYETYFNIDSVLNYYCEIYNNLDYQVRLINFFNLKTLKMLFYVVRKHLK